MALTFKELKKALSKAQEPILALGEDRDGGIKIVKSYEEGGRDSVAFMMAQVNNAQEPNLIFIKSI